MKIEGSCVTFEPCDADNLEIQNSDSLSLLKKLALGCTLLQRADFINMISP